MEVTASTSVICEKKRKSNSYCSVPQCKSYYNNKEISMHRFPKNKKLLRQWGINLKIAKTITKTMLVCSKHFTKSDFFLPAYDKFCKKKRLKLNSIPTQNLPVRKFDLQCSSEKVKRNKLRGERRKAREQLMNQEEEAAEHGEENNCSVHTEQEQEAATTLLALYSCQNNIATYEDKAVQVDTYIENLSYNISDIINNDYRMKSCTGVANINLFKVLVAAVTELTANGSRFPIEKKVLLTLMKIKLDLTFSFLAILFNISESSAGNYFNSTCQALSFSLRSLIRYPSKDEILANMPKCFKQYMKTRVVLDCTEIPIEKFKCLKCRLRTYSHYKGGQTCKFLIGVSPSGMITYISPAYGGRASDKAIFNKENFIEKLIPGQDAVMVDKGFLIKKECDAHFIQLIRPPYLTRKKKQFSKVQAIKTASIARARVHVERAIQRIKLFKIIKNIIPVVVLPNINYIMTIIVGLVNLSEPILSSDKF